MSTADPQLGIGDVASQEKGSGARLNGGKPAWEYMPLTTMAQLFDSFVVNRLEPVNTINLTGALGVFQQEGDYTSAFEVLRKGVIYLMTEKNLNLIQALEEVIKVWEFGAQKYDRFNWMKGMSWSAVLACCQRHVNYLLQGQELDDESGLHHGAHFICNAIMLVHFVNWYPEGNDLPCQWFK